jgi:formyltetrahydrofolate-dependent phosphoribosylglycinamide formyltransferase
MSAEAMPRLAAFCSHGGSNFAAIADAAQGGEIPLEVAVMVHNNARAGAKAKAAARGIPTVWLPRRRFADEAAYAAGILEVLAAHRIDLVALAGFMQRIPPAVVARFAGRMTNIHPALLPLFGGAGFYGMRVHEAVFAAGMKVSGPTVHLVDERYDQGPILMQRAVSIADCAGPEEIAARVLTEEHRIYPETLGLLAEERYRIDGRRATLLPAGGQA